jgi:hypothetical protein
MVRNANPSERRIGLFLGRVGDLYSFLDAKTSEEIFAYMTRNRLKELTIRIVNKSGELAVTNRCGNKVPCEVVISKDNFKYLKNESAESCIIVEDRLRIIMV